MELILINHSKLKVTMSAEDMHTYAISCDTMDYGKASTRGAFRALLEEARQQTGFDAQHDRIFVQVYPVRGGGCELYVTKLGELSENTPPPALAKEPTPCVYAFPTLQRMLCACAHLQQNGYNAQSSAYEDDERTRYFLLLDGKNDAEAILSEYGEPKSGVPVLAYIHEHCTRLCGENAVEIFAKLA